MKKTVIAALAASLAAVTFCSCSGVLPGVSNHRHELGDTFDPKLTAFAGRKHPNVSAVPEQPDVPALPAVQQPAEVLPQMPAQPYVIMADEYTKPVTPYYEGIAYTGADHYIAYPALTLDTPSARAFNEKIAMECLVELEGLKNGWEGPNVYHYYYAYTEKDGVIGIALMKTEGLQASEFFFNCIVYYYDVASDRELTFEEYRDILNIDYYAMYDALSNCGINFTDCYGNPTTLAINMDRYPLLVGALFDDEKTYVVYQTETMENVNTVCTITEPMLDLIQRTY